MSAPVPASRPSLLQGRDGCMRVPRGTRERPRASPHAPDRGRMLLRSALLAIIAAVHGVAVAAGPTTVLPEFADVRGLSERRAGEALAAVERERGRYAVSWAARDKACYDVVLVNACRDRVRAERRAIERELRRIEIGARQLLREFDASRTRESKALRTAQDGELTSQAETRKEALARRSAREADLAERRARNAQRHAQAMENEARYRAKLEAAERRRKSSKPTTSP